MLAGTGRDPGPVPSHEGPVLSHPIPQRSDPIPVPVPCQAWTGSSHPGLVPSHPGPTPGRDGTRTGYPGPGGQPTQVNCDYLSDFDIEIHKAISVQMFFLFTIKTFALCSLFLSFIKFSRDILLN